MFHTSEAVKKDSKIPRILLIDDNPGDIRLIQEAIKECGYPCELDTVGDGIKAIDFLRKTGEFSSAVTPDLILLDLNIPKKDGRSVLKEIKSDIYLRVIPVLVLTISQAEDDILQCYNNYVNCYITKPFTIDSFIQLIKSIVDFWFGMVKLPSKKEIENGRSN